MPKNKVSDPITDQEIAFARLVLSGTMTDRRAAEAVGLNPDSAAYTKSKPRVRAYMLEHRAAVQQQLVQQEAEGQHRLNLDREQVLARLWEIANLSPEVTRGSITGQVKALSMIVAMQNFIPDSPTTSSEKKSPPAPIPPQIYAAAWPVSTGRRFACRSRLSRRAVEARVRSQAHRQRRLRTLAPARPPSPTPLALRKHRRSPLMSPSAVLFPTCLPTFADLPIHKKDLKISNFKNGCQLSATANVVLVNEWGAGYLRRMECAA